MNVIVNQANSNKAAMFYSFNSVVTDCENTATGVVDCACSPCDGGFTGHLCQDCEGRPTSANSYLQSSDKSC